MEISCSNNVIAAHPGHFVKWSAIHGPPPLRERAHEAMACRTNNGHGCTFKISLKCWRFPPLQLVFWTTVKTIIYLWTNPLLPNHSSFDRHPKTNFLLAFSCLEKVILLRRALNIVSSECALISCCTRSIDSPDVILHLAGFTFDTWSRRKQRLDIFEIQEQTLSRTYYKNKALRRYFFQNLVL